MLQIKPPEKSISVNLEPVKKQSCMCTASMTRSKAKFNWLYQDVASAT